MTTGRRSVLFVMAFGVGALMLSHPDSSMTARAQSCTFRVAPTRIDADVAGSSGTVTVTTQDGCTWTATAAEPWIAIDRAEGTGPDTISYVVSPLVLGGGNAPIRQAPIQVRWNTPTLGENALVTQIAGSCTAAFSPSPGPTSAETFGGAGGGGNLWVLAEPAFSGQWFIRNTPAWITLTSPPRGVFGRGDGQSYFAVGANPSTEPRDGLIELCDGRTIGVHQSGRSLRTGRYVPGDFDDDGRADLAIYRPSNGAWYVLRSSSGYSYPDYRAYIWGGNPGDVPLAGDFDGDKKTDLAVVQTQNVPGAAASWNLRYSSNDFRLATATGYRWYDMIPGDQPLAADFDADGKRDFVVYRPSTGQWFIRFTSVRVPGGGALPTMQWGLPGDIPVPGDWDGDGRADLVVWRPSNGVWYIRGSRRGFRYEDVQSYQWGLPGDIPVAFDWLGDARNDLAVFRPSDGRWYIKDPRIDFIASNVRIEWGTAGDIPVPSDYDGDGRTDLAVWRPSTGTWYVLLHYDYRFAVAKTWGEPGDVPVVR